MLYLAELSYGAESAQEILADAKNLATETTISWQRIWDLTLAPGATVGLWTSMVNLGSLLAAISLLYVAYQEMSKVGDANWGELIQSFVPLILVGIFLAGNGAALAKTIYLSRDFHNGIVLEIYEAQIDGVSFNAALEAIQETNMANGRARQILAECTDKTGVALEECLADPAKLEEIEDSLSEESGLLAGNLLEILQLVLNPLAVAVTTAGTVATEAVLDQKGAVQVMTEMASTPFIAIVDSILYALQWAFVNGVEVARLLTALYAPIAFGLSVLPLAGRYFFAWLSGYLALSGLQIGYTIVTGLIAIVISMTSTNAPSMSHLMTDLGFSLFISIISPILAGLIATGGGIALYSGISRAGKEGLKMATNTISSGIAMGIKLFL